MFRKFFWLVLLATFALLAPAAVGQGDSAYLRLMQLANDNTSVSLTLQDGTVIISNLAPGSVSDYLPNEPDRSALVTLTISPRNARSYTREWAVPPLSPGYHTASVVGSGRDNTLQLIFIDEDTLCADKLVSSSCVIFVNNLRNSPPLAITANVTPVVDNSVYRQAVVGSVPAATYQLFTAAPENNPQSIIFQLQQDFFEPNVIHFYTITGNYPGRSASDYTIGDLHRVPVDNMTFLRGLTADLQLTYNSTLIATENMVAILDASGYSPLLANSALPLTVFAPTDQAILDAAPNLYQCVTTNPAAARALILNHILAGSYTSAQLASVGHVASMVGTTHTFLRVQGGLLIDNTVLVPDRLSYPTINGEVYMINDVLIPPGFENQYCTSG